MVEPQSTVYQGDCMDFMAQYPDNYFELAIVDPPYGIGAAKMQLGFSAASRIEKKRWDDSPPDDIYFRELARVSSHQIVWGGNYFPQVWPGRCVIVWDKGASFKGRSFAECELAWTSFDAVARIAVIAPFSCPDMTSKIHKTQKPIPLYEWLLKNYAKQGDKVLDTHMGSQSSRIAAWKHGFDYWGSELDEDYFKSGCERFERESKQPMLLRI